MQHDWRAALDEIHADEGLKQRTRQFVGRHRPAARPRLLRRRLYVYAACACLALCVLAAGGYLYLTPTALIGVDIAPSLELAVNRFDRVIGVSGYNEDGRQLAESLDLLHQPYTQAVEQVLSSEMVQACLARDEQLSLAVVEIDARQGEAILQYLARRTAGQQNSHCYALAPEEAQQAHELGLSYGKYRIYQEILAYTDAYSPEQIAGMTMRQIRELLAASQAGDPAMPGGGQGGTGGRGHRYGWQADTP